jgi:hypothetical protein
VEDTHKKFSTIILKRRKIRGDREKYGEAGTGGSLILA